jgi:hypothetical protein
MNSRINDLRSHMDSRFDEMRATWHSELRRAKKCSTPASNTSKSANPCYLLFTPLKPETGPT